MFLDLFTNTFHEAVAPSMTCVAMHVASFLPLSRISPSLENDKYFASSLVGWT